MATSAGGKTGAFMGFRLLCGRDALGAFGTRRNPNLRRWLIRSMRLRTFMPAWAFLRRNTGGAYRRRSCAAPSRLFLRRPLCRPSTSSRPTTAKPGAKPEAAERAVQAGDRILHPGARPQPRARGHLLHRQAGAGDRARRAPRRGCPSRRARPLRARRRSCAGSPIPSRFGSPATARRSIAASRRRTRRRARCSTPSSRPASRRSARAAWRAWRRT